MPRGLGAVARAAHRAQPSDPPSRTTEQAQPGVRTLAVPLSRKRRSVGASVSTRRSGHSVPARSGAMAPVARGADLPTALPSAVGLHNRSHHTGDARAQGRPTVLREGGIQSARRVPAAMPPEAAGTRRADRGWGIGDAASSGHRGDPGPRRAAGSQPEESRRAASGGEQAPSGRAPARPNKSRHAAKRKKLAPGPRGKRKKPSRSEKENRTGTRLAKQGRPRVI